MKMKLHKFFLLVLIFTGFGIFSACENPGKSVLQYTVKFEANGGIPAPKSQIVMQGHKVSEPVSMSKTGHGFGGWYREATFINLWDFTIDTVTGNITLYAKWDINYSTVRFEANGGIPAPKSQIVMQGHKVSEPVSMSKIGHGFGGWYREATFINLWDFTIDTVTGIITLYAKWDINYRTVRFEANGGSPAPEQQNIAYGSMVVTPQPITKSGYTFDGWYTEAACINLWVFDGGTVTNDLILYAKWLENFTVTFEAYGGSQAPEQQIIVSGKKVIEPSAIYKSGSNFEGWYKDVDFINLWDFNSEVVSRNTILYAKWGPSILVPGASFSLKIRWLEINAQSCCDYTIEVDSNQSIGPIIFSYSNKNNITITLKGIGSLRIFSLSSNGSMFTIESGVTLILEDNLKLNGKIDNTVPLLRVNSGGKLVLNDGVEISNNINRPNNSDSSFGGGIYVDIDGSFTMNGGIISNNSSSSSSRIGSSRSPNSYGGGVYISNATFIMNGGEIVNNQCNAPDGTSFGGGVYIGNSGNFFMNNGKIFNNQCKSAEYNSYYVYGSGVYIGYNGSFTMNGGEISSNTS